MTDFEIGGFRRSNADHMLPIVQRGKCIVPRAGWGPCRVYGVAHTTIVTEDDRSHKVAVSSSRRR